jgi:hypothetical protein
MSLARFHPETPPPLVGSSLPTNLGGGWADLGYYTVITNK